MHDLHVWTITSGFPALSAHVLVGRGEDCHGRRRELERLLHDEFGIEHTTLQVDHASEPARSSSWSASRASKAKARPLTGGDGSHVLDDAEHRRRRGRRASSEAASVTSANVALPDRVTCARLEEAMRDNHFGADELVASCDRLDDERAGVEDELEVELVDPSCRPRTHRARRTCAVLTLLAEVRVARADAVEQRSVPRGALSSVA